MYAMYASITIKMLEIFDVCVAYAHICAEDTKTVWIVAAGNDRISYLLLLLLFFLFPQRVYSFFTRIYIIFYIWLYCAAFFSLSLSLSNIMRFIFHLRHTGSVLSNA